MKSRTAWNNPADIAAQSRFGVTSRVFQPADRSKYKTVDASKTRSAVDYELHPWIKAVTKGDKAEWKPNPERVQFFHKDGDTLVRLEDSNNPSLRYGDLYKVVFKISVGVSAATWSMSFVPVQMIRTMEGDGYISGGYGGAVLEDDTSARILKAGATLTPIRSKKLISITIL